MQESDDDLWNTFTAVEREELGPRWRAALPRETDTSNVDHVPVSRSATPNQVLVSRSATRNPVTSSQTITRPPGTVLHVLWQNAMVKLKIKYELKAGLNVAL